MDHLKGVRKADKNIFSQNVRTRIYSNLLHGVIWNEFLSVPSGIRWGKNYLCIANCIEDVLYFHGLKPNAV
jgi:hypothetical protein